MNEIINNFCEYADRVKDTGGKDVPAPMKMICLAFLIIWYALVGVYWAIGTLTAVIWGPVYIVCKFRKKDNGGNEE